MKKFVIILLVSSSFYCLKSKDSIEESIANLQPEKLREILSHNLLMKAEDKAKYVNQVETIINQIEKWEKNGDGLLSILKYLRRDRLTHNLMETIGRVFVVASFFNLFNRWAKIIQTPWDDANLGIAFSSTVVSVAMVITLASKETIFKRASSAYKRAYYIKALIEKVEVTDSVS